MLLTPHARGLPAALVVGVAVRVPVAVLAAVGVRVAEAVPVRVADAEGVWLAVAVGVAVADGIGDCVAEAVGAGVGVPRLCLTASGMKLSVPFMPAGPPGTAGRGHSPKPIKPMQRTTTRRRRWSNRIAGHLHAYHRDTTVKFINANIP
jgi:hypothetical protein